jgi:hypothetical protein
MKWLFAGVLALQAHFAASYLVPLDDRAQREFGGLLRWVWPWAIGDRGPLGEMTATGFPVPAFFIAVTGAGLLVMAALAVVDLWVPADWWRPLAIGGAVLGIALFALFLGPTKIVPIMTAIGVAYAAIANVAPTSLAAVR